MIFFCKFNLLLQLRILQVKILNLLMKLDLRLSLSFLFNHFLQLGNLTIKLFYKFLFPLDLLLLYYHWLFHLFVFIYDLIKFCIALNPFLLPLYALLKPLDLRFQFNYFLLEYSLIFVFQFQTVSLSFLLSLQTFVLRLQILFIKSKI